jgi:hypothetical protein
VSACLLALVVGAFCVLRPGWATDIGFDVWNLPALERNMEYQAQVKDRLNRHDEVIKERIVAKEQVVRDLLAGRLTLLEAAAWFRRLNIEPPEYPGTPPDCFPGRTENERYCRQLIQWVNVETREWAPSHAEEVRCRLEWELDVHLVEHDGEVELPDV